MNDSILVTFNVSKELLSNFDNLLKKMKKESLVDKSATRSSIIREYVMACVIDWKVKLQQAFPYELELEE